MNREELGRAVRDHVARIEQLACVIDRTFWSVRSGERMNDVRSYLDRIVAHIVGADGRHAMAESMFLKSIGGTDLATWQEASADASATASRHPDAPSGVPEFIRAARRQDQGSGTRIVAALTGEIESLCALVALADGHAGEAESDVIAAVIAAIKAL